MISSASSPLGDIPGAGKDEGPFRGVGGAYLAQDGKEAEEALAWLQVECPGAGSAIENDQ